MKPQDIFNLIIKVGPYIKKVLKELSSYESRVRELAKDVSKLQRKQKRVQSKAREEERRHGRTIDDEVVQWLKGVDQIICLYGNFLKDEESQYAVFSNGYLPKPAIRYRLSVMVIYITKRVKGLLDTNLDNFSYLSGPPSFDADFDNIRYEMYESRNQTRAEIMAALADSNVGLIGVYGLSGVGKTSLIKEVAMEVKVNMFDEVIMVNVTSRPDIRSIQGQIADNLGVELKEESESGRAARLREILKNPKDKTLLILDNMVVKLDLNMLGIPSANIASSQTNHKTLMISSSEQLLLRQTDGRRIRKIRVEALTEEEAESMFKTMAEMGEDSTFKSLAAQIAKKCRGLPMTIVTTATALKGKSLPIWKDAYRRLESQNLTARPEFSTKLSYELLEDKELKHTFLICARMNHDALITDLVRYCIALGLFQGIYTVREATDRVHALVAKLKDLSLLSDSFSRDRFTMQDVVRDAALSIASQQMNAFALTKGKLDEWPDIDKLKRYTAISFDHCDLTDLMKEFSKPINCPRLRVFHLDNKDPLLHIPDNFFNAMKELRLLTLIGLHLSSLSSIKCLKKLRMLCLERCKLGDLSAIGELEKLRVLSLSGSDYDKLPAEFSQLTKLQILDMSDSFKLENIPAGVLSSLTSLEELYAGSSHIWKGQGNANLSELRQLNQLTTLDIQIPKITHFPENLFFDRLDSYKIVVREFNEYPEWDFKVLEMCEASRYLALQPENGFDIHHWKGIKILFERVENLLLGQLNDVDDIFSELNYEGFPYLKYLSIASNSKVQSIINSKNQNLPEKAFPELESLFLYEVNNMQHIFQSKFTPDSFCNLKIIKIKRCGQLKNVFFSSMIQHLSALETMEVSDCKSLKEIVTMKRDSNRSTDDIKFPGLRSLTLQYLSELNGFYTDDASTGKQALNTKPGELFDEKLDVNDCMNLRYLLSLSMAKILMNLQSLYVSQCGMMESIFKMEVSLTDIEKAFYKILHVIYASISCPTLLCGNSITVYDLQVPWS
ncbi:unnamed protein product [Sphenostylis stenocarpa]|uniref:AAA+ ATPase domain-containing protein n=1 Tax=Sphenostylis stenocarpa TaxID=92480 RepID=A0AA86VJA0_9FABA|nr:unnamed protein product [Sphenostylis stenocarpa]